jgi:hypothetical protein
MEEDVIGLEIPVQNIVLIEYLKRFQQLLKDQQS